MQIINIFGDIVHVPVHASFVSDCINVYKMWLTVIIAPPVEDVTKFRDFIFLMNRNERFQNDETTDEKVDQLY